MKTDNTTANGVINGTAKQQMSTAIDMRFYWLKDRAEQGQFKIHWAPGDENWADYFTKHHSPAHHKLVRPVFQKEQTSPIDLQGCVELIKGHQPAGKRSRAMGLSLAVQMAARVQARMANCQAHQPHYQRHWWWPTASSNHNYFRQ